MTSTWQSKRRPHRFLVELDDEECADNYATAVAAGMDPSSPDVECCWPLCFRVVQVECPYGPTEEHVDCALFMECDCVYPENDDQYDEAANFTYKVNLDLPVGDPDRYVRVWDEGSSPQGIALALAFELAMDEYDDKHESHPGFEPVDPPRCWVATFAEDVTEALEQALGGTLTVGWHTAYVGNGGDVEESYLELELVEPAEVCS